MAAARAFPLYPKLLVLLCLTLPAACTFATDEQDDTAPKQSQDQTQSPDAEADLLAARDPAPGEAAEAGPRDSRPRPVMQAQVVLERIGFASGVVDGRAGLAFGHALEGFQEARGLPVTGKLDDATRAALTPWDSIPATRIVTIPALWGAEAFAPLPEGMAEQAQMTRLGYTSMAEKLAERFHTTPAVLAELNFGVSHFTPGQQVRVPNVGADQLDPGAIDDKNWLATLRALGVGTSQPEVARILVDESDGWLKAFDGDGRLVAIFTVTTGSRRDPLPIGDWQVKGIAYNPPFAFDPELFWDVPDSEEKQRLPPGPNGPVGVVWIDLSKEHYGIHGTPEPAAIGRSESHGCVRLTNWDAARLAQMVSGGTRVEFRK
jgi:lipoprotein-anchoring transpeptidase ErfK/SrfK